MIYPKEKAGKWQVPIPKVKAMTEDEMFKILRSGKRKKKAWKRIVNKVSFVGDNFTRKPPKFERYIRPSALRFKKAHVTHPELKMTFCLEIVSVKKNPQSALYTNLGVITKGGVEREKWNKFKFRKGQLLEAAVRDDEGRAQGTLLLEIKEGILTSVGGMKRVREPLAKSAYYHFCEDNSKDCQVTRSGRHVHLEKFREITSRELESKVPGWAFGRPCVTAVEEYKKRQGITPAKGEKREELPWMGSGDEESDSEASSSGKDLRTKLQQARDDLKKLERRMKEHKGKKKKQPEGRGEAKRRSRSKQKKERSRSKKPRRRGDDSRSPARGREKEKKKRQKKDSEESDKDKKKAKKAKAKEKADDSSSSSDGDGEKLFGEEGTDREEGRGGRGRKDRGPFGGGEVRRYKESTDSDSDSFRDAPADRKASSQLRLTRYAQKMPGRLASRLLLKMLKESAHGSVGAVTGSQNPTPPSAVHYLMTVMSPGNQTQHEIAERTKNLVHSSGHAGSKATRPCGGRPVAESEGSREGDDGRPLGLGTISRTAEPRAERPSGKRRTGVHQPGVPVGPEIEGPGKQVAESPQRRSERRSRKRRQEREGERQRKRRDKGEEGRSVVTPRETKPTWEREEWSARWKAWMSEPRSPADVLSGLWAKIKKSDSPLGHLAALSASEGVPPGPKAENLKVRGDDLLPIDPKAVATYLLDKGHKISDSVSLIVNSLNYLTLCPGGDECPKAFPDRPLSVAQQATVDHLCAAVEHVEALGLKCPGFEEASKSLAMAKFDYMGEPVVPMQDIIADQVIAAWPQVGEAAIQDAVDYLPENLKKKLLDPGRCLKQLHEWPESPHPSKVRASTEEWEKVVRAGHLRGLMVPVKEDEVFKDLAGNPVVSGAGAVPKVKTINGQPKHVQRFISNLIPANAYQERLAGDDRLLPYLGQLTLLEQGENEIWLIDSEDFVSCFNLFRLPPCWYRYMAFEKKVCASVFGGEAGTMVYAAMAVLPMGWVSSVAIIQSIVRTLVFDEAGVPSSSEIAKTKKIPAEEDLTVIYLDSFDELRRVNRNCREVLEGKMSDRHKAFLKVCSDKGLPLNEGKRVVASTHGMLQGGELDGDLGTYGLSREKMAYLIGLGGAVLGHRKCGEFLMRHFVGKATFGMCFRRPLMAVFQRIFEEIQDRVHDRGSAMPPNEVFDEVVMVTSLIPLMKTNLKAPIDEEISVTDASPSGGGAAVASEFRREPMTVEPEPDRCYECGTRLRGLLSVEHASAPWHAFFCIVRLTMQLTKNVRGVPGDHQSSGSALKP
eukprot:s5114_g2.t1